MTATPLLDWTPRYPDVPGAKAPGTSQEAAEKVSKRVAYLQGKCLEALRTHGPLTADEIAEKVGETILSIRPRCSELKRAGEIQKTVARRKNISGCSATVWRIT
jgi:predicted ArsR family transcriptional regulator